MFMSHFNTRVCQAESNPRLTSSSPSTNVASSATALTITGSGFMTGGSVALLNQTTGVRTACTAYNRVSPTSVTCTTPSLLGQPGVYALIVSNPDGQCASIPYTLT